MQKDLLSKLLNNNVSVNIKYLPSHSLYSANMQLSKAYDTHPSPWIISSQDTGKTITKAIEKAYSDLIFNVSELATQIDTHYSIYCDFNIENSKILTSLKIQRQEKCDGESIAWIYHKLKSEESAELLLIQAKKFIVDELTKIKESIS